MEFSVLILTLNEEKNIGQCINSVNKFSDDIHVLDSMSTDKTVSIAKSSGCRVSQRKFDSWANHQNWAMENIEFKHDWVLYIDADERVTEKLGNEIKSIIPSAYKGYRLKRRNYFVCGKPLNFSMKCPGIIRLFKKSEVTFERQINPITKIDGEVGYIRHRLDHYNFSKGINEWIMKHLDYANREAQELGYSNADVNFAKNFSRNFKFRFVWRFLYQYIIKLGFLDGKAGYDYCILISFYEHLIEMYKQG